jgi:hypothetical protein
MKNLILLTVVSFMFACNSTDCTNGVQDGTETGVDCGGDCPVCETCSDGILNQDEVGIDCGGAECLPCAIDYLANGTNGQNILFGDANLTVSANGDYSLRAEVLEGSTLKIVMTTNGGVWGYGAGSVVGWSVNTYNGTQTFEVLNPGVVDLHFVSFSGSTGSFLVEYYENSTTVTKQKTVTWN